MAAPATLAPAPPAVGAPLPSDPGTLRLLALELRRKHHYGDARACERAAAALDRAPRTDSPAQLRLQLETAHA